MAARRRHYQAKGTRISTRIAPDIQTRVARSAGVARGMVRLVDEMGQRANATAPVGEGTHGGVHLRDTFVSEVQITPEGVVGLLGYMAWWAHFPHNGTVRQPANPWLLNAVLSVLVTGRQRAAA